MKTKLKACRISHNPYKEDMTTEITERVFEIDGYQVAERLLEGFLFLIYFDENGKILEVDLNEQQKKFFEDSFNSKKWYSEVRKYAKRSLEGDEVDVPDFIKDKYFKNGVNCTYLINE